MKFWTLFAKARAKVFLAKAQRRKVLIENPLRLCAFARNIFSRKSFARNFVWVLVLGWAGLSSLVAQKITSHDILQTATTDERLALNQQTVAFARSLQYRVPLIRKVEARIGFNGSTLGDTLFGTIHNEDFYGFVISPNSLRERRRQGDLQVAQVGIYENERAVLLEDLVLDRCQVLVSLHFATQLNASRSELLRLLGKKENLLSEMLDQGLDVKVKDVLDTENDRNTLELAQSDLEHSRSLQRAKLSQWLPDHNNLQLDDSDYIRPMTITQRIEMLKAVPNQNPSLAYRNAETRFAAADWALENAQERQIFNFLQVAYQDPVLTLETPKNRKTFNNFSVRIGLGLPIPGNNNPKRSEAALQLREAEVSAQVTRTINERGVDLQYVRVKNLLDQYRACEEKVQHSLIQKMLDNESLRPQMTALELADLQLAQQKLRLRLIEIEQELNVEYLKLLELKGVLGQEPVRDYFSDSSF